MLEYAGLISDAYIAIAATNSNIDKIMLNALFVEAFILLKCLLISKSL